MKAVLFLASDEDVCAGEELVVTEVGLNWLQG